jgi:hypothetical protein
MAETLNALQSALPHVAVRRVDGYIFAQGGRCWATARWHCHFLPAVNMLTDYFVNIASKDRQPRARKGVEEISPT